MSGSISISQMQQVPSRLSGSENISADDAAASLRAAALLTLKSNRRKGHTGFELPASLPPRPTTTDVSIELDYGTEEPAIDASSSPQPVSPPVAIPRPAPAPEPMDIDEGQVRDEGQIREEGEISDTESTPAPRSPQTSLRSVPPQPQPTTQLPPKDRPTQSPVIPPSSTKAESKQHPLPEPRINLPVHLSSFDNAPMLIDEDHARPGLAMNQAQYDTAKDIVLDLLGWGVPPEYLVDCGLSREIVYYVFVELNLRLPNNLDMTGLPHLDSTYFTGSPEPITPPPTHSPRQRSNSSAIRPTPPSRLVQGHPSLPQKPCAPQGTDDSGSQPHLLSATATPFVPTASTSAVPMSAPDSPPSLIDIEQQRRQELLARKAVLASRKSKLAAANASPPSRRPTVVTSLEVKDVEMALPAVPKETVDTFLSSIPAVSGDTSPASYRDEMDVDTIPGLSMNRNGVSPPDSLQHSTSGAPSTDAFAVSDRIQPEAGSSGQSTRDPSMERGTERSTSVEDKSDSSVQRPRNNRRSSKRPVAADFVDMEPRFSRFQPKQDAAVRVSYATTPPRKRPQSFAGLTRARRIVIDLSDSEEEADGIANGLMTHALHRRPPSRLGAAATVPQIRSPALLLEKEQEIKRMKELIAARERAMRGKLAANSNRSTPPLSVAGSSPAPLGTTVKQEEDDYAASVSLKPMAEDTEVPLSATSSLDQSTSTSGPPTPIGPLFGYSLESRQLTVDRTFTEIASSTMEHPATGDKVITAEARQEQVAYHRPRVTSVQPEDSNPPIAVDVVGSVVEASSAQIAALEADRKGKYTNYQSIMSLYPLLNFHLPHPHFLEDVTLALNSTLSSDRLPDSGISGVVPTVDLKPLKAVAFYNWLQDPSRFLCQYEIPGGGECRDRECEDIHLSRAWAVEPDDEETARYLCGVLPDSTHFTEQTMQATLKRVRLQHANTSLEARVSDALGSLGLQAVP